MAPHLTDSIRCTDDGALCAAGSSSRCHHFACPPPGTCSAQAALISPPLFVFAGDFCVFCCFFSSSRSSVGRCVSRLLCWGGGWCVGGGFGSRWSLFPSSLPRKPTGADGRSDAGKHQRWVPSIRGRQPQILLLLTATRLWHTEQVRRGCFSAV